MYVEPGRLLGTVPLPRPFEQCFHLARSSSTRRPGARARAASSMILIMIESVMCDIIGECDL